MKDCSRMDLAAEAASRKAVKKPLPIVARFAESGGILETLEGPMSYNAGDAILTGGKNEQWPVERRVFIETYVPCEDEGGVSARQAAAAQEIADAGPAELDSAQPGRYVKRAFPVFALQMSENFFVRKDRGTLRGGPGDWLVQYAPGDLAVVSGEVFRLYYSLMEP